MMRGSSVKAGAALAWFAVLAIPVGAQAAGIDIRGQFSLWLAAHNRPAWESGVGLRYIPTFSWKSETAGGLVFDVEASLNAYAAARGVSFRGAATSGALKPYRAWVRLSTARFEARLGLQKINFGSALLLRPLMWFDRIDPNDPLQITEGVTGVLLKYTFPGNANVWAWGLYGNDDAKGWETVPTQKRTPEFGGRIQVPLLSGEAALSYHHRRLDSARSLIPLPPGESGNVSEDRIGLDGKWDIGPGVWFEAVLARQDWAAYSQKYQRMINLGLDYTLSLGNGIHLLAEHLLFDAAAEAFGPGTRRSLSALTVDYPLGLLDRIRVLLFRDWTSGDWYRLLTWQRTYDRWSFFVIGFVNPDRYQIYSGRTEASLFAGTGFQITAVFNH